MAGEAPISKNKEKGAAGFKFRPAPGGCFSSGYPFCSLGNESIQGEWPVAALKSGSLWRSARQRSGAKAGLYRHSACGLTAARRGVYGRPPEQGASLGCLDASRPGGAGSSAGLVHGDGRP
jgi:hypothetical protein